MNLLRLSSLDPVNMPQWRWAPFLNHAINCLASLNPEPYPIAEEFLRQEGSTGSKSQPVKVTTCTWACRTN
ncbi:MAG TPA: phycoerythrobilin:ferredoxin oxidoreductase, partial [Prochlorococcus sp.]